ncbi:glycosyltransferase [Psychrobacter sp. SZ93C1]|uniref:glycosyltransferase n=1 Tax=Psychrobacter sp. SZ93C1 TaxID=2792058 RepID=UPI0018CDC6DB|nr:glycosyltransferase [Psychrobacter sp. SZ93C1]MBH0064669.1 glycosyltransferase [Psychrobacter sp. SZ93C1]
MTNNATSISNNLPRENKKKILLVINCLQGGGAERVVLTLGQGFYELGYEVHVLRFKPRVEYDLNPNLIYHLINFKKYKLIPKLERRDKFVSGVVDRYVSKKIGQPDIILSNLDRADSILSHSKMLNIIYVIHTTLSLSYKFKNLDDEQKKLAFSDIYSKNSCICVSEGVQKDFIEIFGDITPTATIHNPIDRDCILELANAFVPEYQNYIIHVGSFKEAKRHDVLLRAYAKTDQSLPLLLLGKGKLKNDIEQLVVELNLEDKVVFLGFLENPFPYIKHAKFKILTSDWEGFALVIAESLVLGTPVISTDCQSGPSELLPQNNLMPMRDIDAIAAKLSLAMKNSEQFHSEFNEALLPITIAKKYIEFASNCENAGEKA